MSIKRWVKGGGEEEWRTDVGQTRLSCRRQIFTCTSCQKNVHTDSFAWETSDAGGWRATDKWGCISSAANQAYLVSFLSLIPVTAAALKTQNAFDGTRTFKLQNSYYKNISFFYILIQLSDILFLPGDQEDQEDPEDKRRIQSNWLLLNLLQRNTAQTAVCRNFRQEALTQMVVITYRKSVRASRTCKSRWTLRTYDTLQKQMTCLIIWNH